MRSLAWFLAACLCWCAVSMPCFAAERQIARHQGLTASVDSNFGCAPSASVTVRAPEASAYTGDRIALQRLLGTVRAGLGADCPILSELNVTGFADGDPAFQATITADDGWRLPVGLGRILAENPLPPLAAETAKCDHEWSDPFVGCWIGVDPARGRGSILNIRKDGTWYWDTPEQLALGQPVFDGKKIEHNYMYLAGPFLTFVQKQGGFFDLVGPYFAAECNVMKLNPYQPFGGSDEPQIFVRLRSPLKINADILKDSAWETTGIGNPGNDKIVESMPDEGSSFTNCVDNFNQDITDEGLLTLVSAVIPGLAIERVLAAKIAEGFLFEKRIIALKSYVSRPAAIRPENFFKNTKYTEKVLSQMRGNDFHGFPESVTAFAKDGKLSTIVGVDKRTRLKLEIPGSYKNRSGNFEFIKEENGEINHRLFWPDGE